MANKIIIQTTNMEKDLVLKVKHISKRLGLDCQELELNKDLKSNLLKLEKENSNLISIIGVTALNKILDLGKKNLLNSVDYDNERFDQHYYKNKSLNLLNSQAEYLSFEEIVKTRFKEDMFIKPSRDIKSFNGGIIFENETVIDYLRRTKGDIKKVEKEIIIKAPLKKIYSEYRFFMYKEEILGSSRYSLNNEYSPDKFVPEYMKEAAITFSKEYEPTSIFVIDLAETDKGVFIVEYQCWNISAFYNSDLFNILGRLSEIKN